MGRLIYPWRRGMQPIFCMCWKFPPLLYPITVVSPSHSLSLLSPVQKTSIPSRFLHCSFVPKETKDVWDKLFKEGNGADVYIITEDTSCIPAHSSILSIDSPVLGNILQQSKVKNGFRYIKIPRVPHEAVYAFVCFLYSSWYVERMLPYSHCA